MSGRDSRRPGDDDLPRETAVPAHSDPTEEPAPIEGPDLIEDPALIEDPGLTPDDDAEAEEDEPLAEVEAGLDDDELSALEAAAVLGGTVDITLPAGFAEERADRLLANAAPSLSRGRVQALIRDGRVTLDGATIADASRRVKPGQKLTVTVPVPEERRLEPEPMALDIVYEDEWLIVVDKPAGLVVHPGAGNDRGTLVSGLLAHGDGRLSSIGAPTRPGVVHRIDKDTSGLIVFAKTDAAHLALARQFADHTIRRAYTAIVWGVPAVDPGRSEGNIGRHATDRQRMAVVTRGGKPAVTHYRIANMVGVVEVSEKPLASVLDCRLETGRTHQIRVHLSHVGHPLVGDPVYGRSPARLQRMEDPRIKAMCSFPRQALHARRLGFVHPVTGRRLKFESPLPQDMRELLASLEFF